MMQQGDIKVPIERIPALAAACGVDPMPLLRCVMEEYAPAVRQVIRRQMQEAHTAEPLTADEAIFLEGYRAATLDRPWCCRGRCRGRILQCISRADDTARPDMDLAPQGE